MQPPTTSHNQPRSPTTIHNHPQPSTTIQNHPQPSTTTHNHPQPFTTTQKLTHNQPQPFTTTQKLPEKAKICHKQLCYCTLDANTEADVDFDSDMKQWYIYMCVSVCIYFISHYIYYFLVRLIVCFCQH